ncbi:MAG: hypothetical protein RLY86_3965 [Pseudomonadota bacterium]|jgi:molecular chaperone HscB
MTDLLGLPGGLSSCWFCGKGVSAQALFCHACGSLQPPGEMDAFARLRLPRRFDLTSVEIERQAAGFARILGADRLEKRGAMERTQADRHRAALTAATDTLRDPAARARLLLVLAGRELASADPPAAWLDRVEQAPVPTVLDKMGVELLAEMEGAVRALSAAFRVGDLDTAANRTLHLEGLQQVLERLRRRRRDLTAGSAGF